MSKFAAFGIHEWDNVVLGAKERYPTKEDFIKAMIWEDEYWAEHPPTPDQIQDAGVWGCVCAGFDEPGFHYHADLTDRVPKRRGVVPAWQFGKW